MADKKKVPWNKGNHIQTNTGRTHFKKGCVSFNKGKKGLFKLSEEHKQKLINSRLGKKQSFETVQKRIEKTWGKKRSEEFRKRCSKRMNGHTPWNKGKTGVYSEETIEKMRKASTGRKLPPLSEECKKRLSEQHIGKKLSNEHRKKLSDSHRTPINIQKSRELMLKRRKHIIFPLKDTSIEIKLQNELTQRGIQFRKHEPILGQPDIFIEPNICIFVDGCYWHGCCQCKDRNKLNGWQRGRIVKDQFITQKLFDEGYIVLRFWEHQINADVIGCVDEIARGIQNDIRQ